MQENRDYDFRENANKRLLKTWDTLLQDFQSIEHSIWGGNRINIPSELEKQFNTRHIFMVFVTILDYFYEYQPVEKVEWFIPLKYKGVVFQMGNMKYGFRIFVFDREIEDDIVKEFLKKLCSIIKLSDGLISPYLSDLMNAGECTLKNEFGFLYRMYSFFKKELLDNEELITRAKAKIKEKEISRNEIKEIAIQVHDKNMQSFYYFYAMMDAFFSLLEHLCVLLLAMDEKFMPSNENIQKFIFDTNWTEKYNRIFQDADIKYKKRYNELHIVKEKYRNTFAHGAFEKNGNPVFVHVPKVGAVPIALSKYKDTVRSSYLPVKNKSYLELIETFEGFFDDLKDDKFFARKYEIIRKMNEIVYNSEYHKKYVDAIKSKKKLKEFFEVQELLLVRYQDMDW